MVAEGDPPGKVFSLGHGLRGTRAEDMEHTS